MLQKGEPMNDLISRQAAIEAVGYYSLHSGDKLLFADKPLKELPTIDPVKHGKRDTEAYMAIIINLLENIDSIIEEHERIGYEKGFRDGLAEAETRGE